MGMLAQCVEWLESGEKTPADLLALCRTRIAERDPGLRAWVEVSPQPALAPGPLDGIPFGAKDIFETRGMATEFGSAVFAGRKGQADAALIVQLRSQGAVLVGKTQTTAFASFDPSPTRNPRNPAHTPGGSSSGSAAAVAAGMVPFALGSQTQGSVLRPASYCGVAGFKPTYGLLPMDGVLPFAPTLDTAGLFTQDAADMRLLWSRMGYPAAAGTPHICAVPDRVDAEPEMEQAFAQTVSKLRAEGFCIATIEFPPTWPDLLTASRLVNQYEGARTHQLAWRQHGARIGAQVAQLIADGLALPESRYVQALAVIAEMKTKMDLVFREYPVIFTPAAPGPAPFSLKSTGDPRMNSPWTALGAPAIAVPMPRGDAMPLGLQMTARRGDDALLLDFAAQTIPPTRRAPPIPPR
jgi:Asp-tRNA(Asn)/Glu-tRNA(Gln) amidotransferase A subunit family amidase